MKSHNYFVYITTNPKRSTLYVGMTNDLQRRLQEHFMNSGDAATFAGRYYCYNFIYFERHTQIEHAIEREKEIKKMEQGQERSINQYSKSFLEISESGNSGLSIK